MTHTVLLFTDHDHLQLLGIIRGLSYLHRHTVIHGDLKGVRTHDTHRDYD